MLRPFSAIFAAIRWRVKVAITCKAAQNPMLAKLAAALITLLLCVRPGAVWGEPSLRPELWRAALNAEATHKSEIHNSQVLAVIDYSLPSNTRRLFLIDRVSDTVSAFLVAHGRGSDPDKTGRATRFSDEPQSKMSSLGAFVTGDPYNGAHGLSLILNGLDAGNRHARLRAIVIHGAPYVRGDLPILGRSWGCPAVEPAKIDEIINALKGGALLYIGR